MRTACVDTHALSWYLQRPSRLAKQAVRWFRDADRGRVELVIPAIVIVELGLLREIHRKVVGPAEVQALLAVQPSFSVAPLDTAQAVEFSLLSSLAEPFDRLIVAAARSLGVPLISGDDVITSSGLVETIWD